MVWLSYVRPVLEYGCEVWVPKAKEKDALESDASGGEHLQAQRARQSARGPRAHARPQVRSTASALKYFAKGLSVDLERLVKYSIHAP